MKRHVYYRIEMQLASPMSIGSGRNEATDHDAVRGKDGKPYIPASSIAGVFRHTLDGNTSLQNQIFGVINGNECRSSQIIFYDGQLISKGISSVRDCVKLERKVGVDGAKFDMEVIETGEKFVTFLEIANQNDETDHAIEEMLSKLKAGVLRLGSKTSRGYGAVKISSLKKRIFDLEQEAQLDQWLDFDLYDEISWNKTEEYTIADDYDGYTRITLQLRQNGAISIRQYVTDVGAEGETLPDYKHIALRDGTGIIPGSSWAGAFRSRYLEFAGQKAADSLFGYVNEKNKTDMTHRSRIVFSESMISDDFPKTMTRNSIDRFSAATKDTALYTERTSYYGKTELNILLADEVTATEKAILAAVILDLHHGFLAVGGLTAVGRGMFHVTGLTVNGEDRTVLLDSASTAELLEVE